MYSVYMLKRMQILIDSETKYLVEQKAKREGKSVSETIRNALQKELTKSATKNIDGYEILMNMAKNSVKGPKSTINIDKVVYEL